MSGRSCGHVEPVAEQLELPVGEVVPSGQLVQLELPVVSAKEPAGHGEQATLPMVPAKEPGWHGAQVRLFAMEEKVPTWQGEQMVPLMKLPGWQVVLGVQLWLLELPTGDVVPAGHGLQVELPSVSA